MFSITHNLYLSSVSARTNNDCDLCANTHTRSISNRITRYRSVQSTHYILFDKSVQSIHYILFTILYLIDLLSREYGVWTTHYSLINILSTQWIYSVQCADYTLFSTQYSVQSALFSTQYSVQSALNIVCTLHSIQCVVCTILHTIQCVVCTILHSIQCVVCTILHSKYSLLNRSIQDIASTGVCGLHTIL